MAYIVDTVLRELIRDDMKWNTLKIQGQCLVLAFLNLLLLSHNLKQNESKESEGGVQHSEPLGL
jgi:hypothetical protein